MLVPRLPLHSKNQDASKEMKLDFLSWKLLVLLISFTLAQRLQDQSEVTEEFSFWPFSPEL
jgi:hypothetical protein